MAPNRPQAASGASLAVHADWSIRPEKRWMTVARPAPSGWLINAPEPVGPPATLLTRLVQRAAGGAVALGLDCPIGVPRGFARHYPAAADLPALLRALPDRFLDVAATLDEVSPARPFYPTRGIAGMTRAAHAAALGLDGPAGLSRACDRATATRPAGAPVFWTLGANQSGKAAISAWRDMLIPALREPMPPALWPFDGPFRTLLRPGRVAIAETYPAEAMRHLGLIPHGSKRRQTDRAAYAPGLHAAMAALHAVPDPPLQREIAGGFGGSAAGEDQFDSLLGVLCILGVLAGHRPDTAPADPAIALWEGWVLGQTDAPRLA